MATEGTRALGKVSIHPKLCLSGQITLMGRAGQVRGEEREASDSGVSLRAVSLLWSPALTQELLKCDSSLVLSLHHLDLKCKDIPIPADSEGCSVSCIGVSFTHLPAGGI